MLPAQIDKNYDLGSLAEKMISRLKVNDYVERSLGVFGDDYIDLKVSLSWKHTKDYGSNAYVTLTVVCDKKNLKYFKSQIKDEDVKDSIDSGCEDELRELIEETWGDLDFDWGYGGTKLLADV